MFTQIINRIFDVASSQGWYSPDNLFTWDRFSQDVERLSRDVIKYAREADEDENGERIATLETGPLYVTGTIFYDAWLEKEVEKVEVYVIAGEKRDGEWVNGNTPWSTE